MKHYQKNNGFTLIELLVVVLIIGILSAIALPQYQIAVAKARFVQLQTLGTAIQRAEHRYHMANGEYATDFSNLDIGLPGTYVSAEIVSMGDFRCQVGGNKVEFECRFQNTTDVPVFVSLFSRQNSYVCRSLSLDKTSRSARICQGLGGKFQNCGSSYCDWVI